MADPELTAYLAQIKVGDVIAVTHAMRSGPKEHTVTRVTKKWLNAKWTEYKDHSDWKTTKFSRDDGQEIGETATRHQIVVGASLRAAETEARRFDVRWALREAKYDLTQPDILRMRALADEAEALLRENGEWQDAEQEIADG